MIKERKNSTIETNIPASLQQEFKISVNPKMFEILSSTIYTDKILAPIRELITNAWDEHCKLGKIDTPIDIHLPGMLSSNFVIRDYGAGMSEDDIYNVYTNYGASTKDETNDLVGYFGIGSKSPFAYTSNYTIVSYLGHKELIFNIAVDDGIPKITKIHERVSDKPTGFEVRFDVSPDDFEKFRSKFLNFVLTHPAKFHLIDSKLCVEDYKKDRVLFETEDFVLAFGDNYDYYHSEPELHVLSGGVQYSLNNAPYEVTSKLGTLQEIFTKNIFTALIPNSDVKKKFQVFLKTPVGTVDISSSRESLEYTAGTLTTLESISKKISESILDTFILKFEDEVFVLKNSKNIVSAYNSVISLIQVISTLCRLTDNLNKFARYCSGTFHIDSTLREIVDSGLTPDLFNTLLSKESNTFTGESHEAQLRKIETVVRDATDHLRSLTPNISEGVFLTLIESSKQCAYTTESPKFIKFGCSIEFKHVETALPFSKFLEFLFNLQELKAHEGKAIHFVDFSQFNIRNLHKVKGLYNLGSPPICVLPVKLESVVSSCFENLNSEITTEKYLEEVKVYNARVASKKTKRGKQPLKQYLLRLYNTHRGEHDFAGTLVGAKPILEDYSDLEVDPNKPTIYCRVKNNGIEGISTWGVHKNLMYILIKSLEEDYNVVYTTNKVVIGTPISEFLEKTYLPNLLKKREYTLFQTSILPKFETSHRQFNQIRNFLKPENLNQLKTSEFKNFLICVQKILSVKNPELGSLTENEITFLNTYTGEKKQVTPLGWHETRSLLNGLILEEYLDEYEDFKKVLALVPKNIDNVRNMMETLNTLCLIREKNLATAIKVANCFL